MSVDGCYYTPKQLLESLRGDPVRGIERLLEPAAGTGAFLAQIATNPPFAVTKEVDNGND
jgi:hypothetical protein